MPDHPGHSFRRRPRTRLSAATRISFGLVSLTVSLLFAAEALGLLPDPVRARIESRRQLVETVAVNCSLAVQRDDPHALAGMLASLPARHADVRSAAVRTADGRLLAMTGDHTAGWPGSADGPSTATHMQVPLNQGQAAWASLEVVFDAPGGAGPLAWLLTPWVKVSLFVAAAGFLAYVLYLRRMLRHLDPTAVIPERIRAMLDTLAEGVLVLDGDQRVVLANQAFEQGLGLTLDQVLGRRASDLGWTGPRSDPPPPELPWQQALASGVPQRGTALGRRSPDGQQHLFMVNAAPILGPDGSRRGVLATFDDVTRIEKSNQELNQMVRALQQARDEVDGKNQELELLATRDPLTGCLNRRSFFEQLEAGWTSATRYGHALSCVMVDVDHFKSINDNHGHKIGDQVLQQVADTLRSLARQCDQVGRYGGEEFCVLLPHTDLEGAARAGERFRSAIASRSFCGLKVTASFGVAAHGPELEAPADLLEWADRALYCSKHSGRNCVTRSDQVPDDLPQQGAGDGGGPGRKLTRPTVPFHVVNALTAALAHRDADTARHCRRVADLVVEVARERMGADERLVLEAAALLHDVGKMGVPDAVLKKPGALTGAEWAVMHTHARMGVEIVAAAFACPQLTDMVRFHHAWHGGNPEQPDWPRGDAIPLGARILGLADAYDAITSDRAYRKGRSPAEAFAELRRCAGTQFDPHLVERFIEVVGARLGLSAEAAPPDAAATCPPAPAQAASNVDEAALARAAAKLHDLLDDEAHQDHLERVQVEMRELAGEATRAGQPGPPRPGGRCSPRRTTPAAGAGQGGS